jgi:hypothetical protein
MPNLITESHGQLPVMVIAFAVNDVCFRERIQREFYQQQYINLEMLISLGPIPSKLYHFEAG